MSTKIIPTLTTVWVTITGAIVLVLLAINLSPANDCQPTKSKPCTVKPVELKAGRPETLYDGWIRAINWQQRSLVYESTYGFVRVIGPICRIPDQMPVWQGMRVSELNFHWHQYESVDEQGCYVLDSVEHSLAGDAITK